MHQQSSLPLAMCGSAVVKNGLWSLAKELCKTGCVITHRRDLWCRTLAVDTTQSEVGGAGGMVKGVSAQSITLPPFGNSPPLTMLNSLECFSSSICVNHPLLVPPYQISSASDGLFLT